MRERVYIETTIPSLYHNIRLDAKFVAQREWTREWWDLHRNRFELCSSPVVIDELRDGDHPLKREKIELLDASVTMLPVTHEILDIAETYARHFAMPRHPIADALHLALAAKHACEVLLTWNCAHLANLRKANHLRHVNGLLGLSTPLVATPFQMLESYK